MNKLNKYMSDSFQNFFDNNLSDRDPDLYNSIKLELERQQQHIELIASENIVSKAVLDAQGSIMTNKYAEGYPSKRNYGGCEFVDKAEALALETIFSEAINSICCCCLSSSSFIELYKSGSEVDKSFSKKF